MATTAVEFVSTRLIACRSVYGLMIGNIDGPVAKQINEANDADEEEKTKDRICKALVILANGVSGGEKGMRSDN